MTSPSPHHPKVFISYSHDSPRHIDRVLKFSSRLRADGLDSHIDQYETSPNEGWPRWTANRIEEANFVLVVCTETYERRFRGRGETSQGLGAKWEGAVITQELYDKEGNNTKFIPVLFSSHDSMYIPVFLRAATSYRLDAEDGYDELYRRLTNQPRVFKEELGKIRSLPALNRSRDFLAGVDERETPRLAAAEATLGVKVAAKKRVAELAVAEHSETPETQNENRSKQTIILGALLFAFFVAVFIWAPPQLPDFKQKMLAFASALLAGLASYFMTGNIQVAVSRNLSPAAKIGVRACGGIGVFVFALLWWFSPFARVTVEGAYRVHLKVFDSSGAPVQGDDVRVRSSVSDDITKRDTEWEISIPAAKKPADGKITIWVAKEVAYLSGELGIILGSKLDVQATIALERDRSARLHGTIIDSSRQGVSGVRVCINEKDHCSGDPITTGRNGEFDFGSRWAKREQVQLRLEQGGRDFLVWRMAGKDEEINWTLLERSGGVERR